MLRVPTAGGHGPIDRIGQNRFLAPAHAVPGVDHLAALGVVVHRGQGGPDHRPRRRRRLPPSHPLHEGAATRLDRRQRGTDLGTRSLYLDLPVGVGTRGAAVEFRDPGLERPRRRRRVGGAQPIGRPAAAAGVGDRSDRLGVERNHGEVALVALEVDGQMGQVEVVHGQGGPPVGGARSGAVTGDAPDQPADPTGQRRRRSGLHWGGQGIGLRAEAVVVEDARVRAAVHAPIRLGHGRDVDRRVVLRQA